ncbi:hypothetical protein Dimus_016766 [Dionaea muscipula]
MAARKRSSNAAQRAWELLRLALLWVRKGGLSVELRTLTKCMIKRVNISSSHTNIKYYREHEYSLDNTPVIHIRRIKGRMGGTSGIRMPRIIIPCIGMTEEVDSMDDDAYGDGRGFHKSTFLENVADEEEREREENCDEDGGTPDYGEAGLEDDQGIDAKADEFIAKFYEQIKLQRQNSYIQFYDMINRGSTIS